MKYKQLRTFIFQSNQSPARLPAHVGEEDDLRKRKSTSSMLGFYFDRQLAGEAPAEVQLWQEKLTDRLSAERSSSDGIWPSRHVRWTSVKPAQV